MQTLVHSTFQCPVAGYGVRVEELYMLEGTGTCQIDTQLVAWRCLEYDHCPKTAACPLYQEYAAAGEKSLLDR